MYTRTTLGLEEATKATGAIIKYVQANKERPVSIAVVDDRGELVLFTRMDGAPLNTVNMAIIKAYTSARRRRDTKTIREFHAKYNFDNNDWGDNRFTTVAGGVVIKDTTPVESGLSPMAVAGALGVSGNPTADGDDRLANVGRDALL